MNPVVSDPPAGAPPAAGTPPSAPAGAPAGQGGEVQDAEAIRRHNAELLADLKKTKAVLAAHEKSKADAEAASMTEQQKLAKRLADLEAESADRAKAHQTSITRYEVQLAASRLGIVDPDAAVTLLMAESTLEYDDAGKPKYVEQALKKLIEKRPWLAAQQTQQQAQPGNPTNPARGNAGNGGRLTLESLKAMRPEQIMRLNQAEVNRVLSGG